MFIELQSKTWLALRRSAMFLQIWPIDCGYGWCTIHPTPPEPLTFLRSRYYKHCAADAADR